MNIDQMIEILDNFPTEDTTMEIAREALQQLASEQEQNAHLRKQLWPEHKIELDKAMGLLNKIENLETQLAAEREITFAAQQAALKEGIRSGAAVEALKQCRLNESARRDWDLQDIIIAALAKIEREKKEGAIEMCETFREQLVKLKGKICKP